MKTSLTILTRSVIAALLSTSTVLAQSQNSADEQPAPEDVEVIAVKGTFSQNLIRAIDEKRFSENVVDVILAEDIGKFPDLTTSDALQRVSGVQVARGAGETHTVLVRGLPNVQTTIEGRSIFSTSNRGFNFQDLPAEAVAGIEVHKSRSANQIAGGIAGLIDIKLRNPFDFEGFMGAVSGRVTDEEYTDDPDRNISGLISNRWQVGGGEFGALLNVSSLRDHFQQTNTFTAEMLATDRTPTGEVIGVPLSLGLVSDKGVRDRLQANLALEWQPNNNTTVYLDSLYAGLEDRYHTIFGIGFVFDKDITDYTVSDNPDLCKVREGATPACYVTGGIARNSEILAGTHAKASEVDISQTALGAEWTNQENLTLKTEVVFTDTERFYHAMIQDWHYRGVDIAFKSNDNGHGNFDVVSGDPMNPENYVSGGLFQPWDDSYGEELAWTGDAEYQFQDGFITQVTGGIRLARRTADFYAADLVTTSGPGIGLGASDFGPNYLVPVDMGGATYLDLPGIVAADYEYMLDNEGKIRTIYGRDAGLPPGEPLRSFEAEEDIREGYAQANYETELAGYRVTGRFGVRVSEIERTMASFGNVDGVVTKFEDVSTHTDVLPNVSINLHFADNLLLRTTATKTVSRPGFGDLNPNLNYTPPAPGTPIGYGGGGNPDLEPLESKAFDMSLEYYPEEGGIMSAAIFYRDIKGYVNIEQTLENIDGQDYYITRPYSSGDGYLRGVELNYTTFFTMLPEPFDGLGVQLNYTYIEGPNLTGVSRNNGNAVLIYEKNDFYSRLAYNYRDAYVETFNGAGIQAPATSVVKAAGRVDMSIGYNVTDNFTVTADATNLTDEKFYNYWGHPEHSRDRRDAGRTFSLGASYKF